LQDREILAAEDATENLDGEKEGILGMNPARIAWIEPPAGTTQWRRGCKHSGGGARK
jgi:hypothetical protein